VHKVLEAHAIVVDAVGPEEAIGLFPPALQAALDEAGLRVKFDQMAKVMEGHGVWILEREKIRGRVMKMAGEALGDAEERQPELRRIEDLLESFYGDRRHGPDVTGEGEGRFADADEVQAEVRRIRAAIRKLEHELISIRTRPPAGYGSRRPAPKRGPRDRTQDEVLREIFQHNLELMNLTSKHGITAPPNQ
jgi:hypothetical protein